MSIYTTTKWCSRKETQVPLRDNQSVDVSVSLASQILGIMNLNNPHIINRLPSSYLHGKCPFEILYQRKPQYSSLKSFKWLCYPTTPKVHRENFEPRTISHIFVGYPFGTKGYKLLSLATKKVYVSRDVVFYETIFPLASAPKGVSFDSFSKSLHTIPSISLNSINHDLGYDEYVSVPYSNDPEGESDIKTKPPLHNILQLDVNDPIFQTVEEHVPSRKLSRTQRNLHI